MGAGLESRCLEGAGNPDEGSVQVLNHDRDMAQGRAPCTDIAADIPGTAETSSQTELRKQQAAFQVWVCREHLGPLTMVGFMGNELLSCRRCALVWGPCGRRSANCTASGKMATKMFIAFIIFTETPQRKNMKTEQPEPQHDTMTNPALGKAGVL